MKNQIYIPYFKTSRYKVDAMVELSNVKPGDTMADLGSGDGRILIEFAKAGAKCVGYELDEKLISSSKEKVRELHLEKFVTIRQKDFWEENVSVYSIITVYPMPDIMENLEKKLKQELQPGARVLSNYYQFPNMNYLMSKDTVFLYLL